MLECEYVTGSGNIYPIEMNYKVLRSDEYIFDYEYITSLCSDCGNFRNGGGCPPYAPRFDEIVANNQYSIMVYAKLMSEYKSEAVSECNNYYIHYRSQDVVLSNLLTKLGYCIRDNYDSITFLNNGFCMGCSKKCSFKLGEDVCRRSERRTFSLEATGVNVESTLKKEFGIDLQWYNKDNYNEIDYMVKVIGLFYDDPVIGDEILENFSGYLESLDFIRNVIE